MQNQQNVALGARYGLLTVSGIAPSVRQSNGKMKQAVFAQCDCGAEKAFLLTNLRSGNSKSCGCEKNRGLSAYNADRAKPQAWTIDGESAFIVVKGLKILVDADDVPLVGQYRWGLRNGYAVARGGRLAMHRLILGLEPGDIREADHEKHNKLDNRRSKIRIATSSQNKMNRRGNVVATSSFKGVHFDKSRRRYTAQIKTAERYLYLGRFEKEIDAALAYNAAAAKYFGQFAYLNPVDRGAV